MVRQICCSCPTGIYDHRPSRHRYKQCPQQVQIAPHPDDLKMKILELIDDVTKAAAFARAP